MQYWCISFRPVGLLSERKAPVFGETEMVVESGLNYCAFIDPAPCGIPGQPALATGVFQE